MRIYAVRHVPPDSSGPTVSWMVLAGSPKQALELVRQDPATDSDWQLAIGASASTSQGGDARIVYFRSDRPKRAR